MNFILKITVIVASFFPVFSFAYSVPLFQNMGSGQTNFTTTGISWDYYCAGDSPINRLEYAMYLNPSTSWTVEVEGVVVHTVTPSDYTQYVVTVFDTGEFAPIPCNNETIDIDFIVSAGSGNYRSDSQQNIAALNSWRYGSHNTLRVTGNTLLIPQSFIWHEIESGVSTTYIPIQSELTSLECVTNSPTSTCSFSYSTTTASSTPDYSRHFDLFLLFVGISFFALAVYLFRGLALKYL